MAFPAQTEAALDALRTAIGAATTIGTAPDHETFTWAWKLEGPPLRWLDSLSDYPVIILQPGDTEITGGPALAQCDLTVTLHIVIKASSAFTSVQSNKIYELTRMVGEQVVSDIMDAGKALNTEWVSDRYLLSFGMNYPDTEEVFDDGLAIFGAALMIRYFLGETNAP